MSLKHSSSSEEMNRCKDPEMNLTFPKSVKEYFFCLCFTKYCPGSDLLSLYITCKNKKCCGWGQQENLQAVELHFSLRQHLQSALPASKTRKEQTDGGGAVVLSS